MKIAFHTLGCKVNQYETQALKEQFQKRGYEIVGEDDFADVYVINTCTVTGLSDRKSRQYIRRAKKINPDSITAVIGCYAQVSPEEAKNIEGVNIVAGTNEKSRLPDYIEEYVKANGVECHIKEWDELTEYDETGIITSMDSRTRAYIKVQEGCNRFCSYCIIPYARGSVRSRAVDDVVAEAKSLIAQGFKELVLTGINTALYGMEKDFSPLASGKVSFDENLQNKDQESSNDRKIKDHDEPYGIEILVKEINSLEGDFRIRIGSLEPNVIDADYACRLLKYDKLCPHLHLSLQSGSNRILKEMNRSYTRESYLRLVERLREHDPGFGITTDIIVGFPGETESDFEDSCSIVKMASLSKVHVFKYSKREGTKAAQMKGHISPEVKAKRSEALFRISEKVSEDFCRENLGTVRRVLFEQYDNETGLLEGLSDNYIKIYCEGDETLCNTFVNTELIELYRDGVKGKIK